MSARSPLDAAVEHAPALAGAARLIRTLAAALAELPATLPDGVPHLPAAAMRLAAGIPALEGEPLLDDASLARNVEFLMRMLALDGAASLRERIADDQLATAALQGAWPTIAAAAVRLDCGPDALVTLCDFAARPVLRAGRTAVSALLREARWRRGSCPVCGAAPLLAELAAAERERRLRCGRCAAAWAFPRLRCPACDASEHRNFRYLHGDGDGDSRRLEVCDGCGTYLKSVAVLDPLSTEQLLEVDLATAALDAAAIGLGLRHA